MGNCCSLGQRRRPRREGRRPRRRRGRHHLAGASKTPSQQHTDHAVHGLPLAATSVASDSEYHDAREAWSDADHSPLSSAQISPRAGSITDHPHAGDTYEDISVYGSSSDSESGSESSQASTGLAAKLVGCLSIIRASSAGEDELHRATPRAHHHHSHQGARGHRLPAGCTFARRSPDVQPDDAKLCWDECEASNFQIRSQDYMQTKVKQPSSKAIYRLVAMDLFGADTKAAHVSRIFQLPTTGPPVVCRSAVAGGGEVVLPQLLIMNVQLPDYPAAFWGTNDGRGQSIVYYFQLRDDFDPDKFENTAALGLLQRFVSNGREADGSPTRDRLKLIVRVANLEEWARVGPLNSTEFKLLQNYNEKPVLTRPQQAFHLGANCLEVDLDVHNYAFLARKALWSYHDRLATVVWDMGFVIQGNCPEELPEQVLGCGRIYRSDFRQFRHLSDLQHSNLASASLTPSITSFTGSRNSMGVEGVLTPTAAAAGSDTPAANGSPEGPIAAAAASAAAAMLAAPAAAAGNGAAVSRVSADAAGAAAASSRGSGASGDAAMVVSNASEHAGAAERAAASNDSEAAAAAGKAAGAVSNPSVASAAAAAAGAAGS